MDPFPWTEVTFRIKPLMGLQPRDRPFRKLRPWQARGRSAVAGSFRTVQPAQRRMPSVTALAQAMTASSSEAGFAERALGDVHLRLFRVG